MVSIMEDNKIEDEELQCEECNEEGYVDSEEAMGQIAVQQESQIPSETERYVVSKGDTLYSISKKYNIPIEELKKQNNISDNAISIGQSILIQK